MDTDSKRKHLFISHHHKDDAEVTNVTNLVSRNGWDIRNSSIRALKPENQERLKRGIVKDETIRRWLRKKISWASCVVVLIGKKTHSRPWVNWEIEEAYRQGKRIVGVYIRGATESDVPPSFEKYGSTIVGWNAENIMAAINGLTNAFQNPDGTTRSATQARVSLRC